MHVEVDLRIYDDKEDCQARQSILFVEESVKPVPAIGDIITLVVSDEVYRGKVFARHFDYSQVQEGNPEAQVRIVIDAKEQV